MIQFRTEYRVNKNHTREFERAYASTGQFGGMFVRNGCKGYMLLRHKIEQERYLLVHTWTDLAAFRRAQEMAAQESYRFQQQSQGWVQSVNDLGVAEVTSADEGSDDQFEILSRA